MKPAGHISLPICMHDANAVFVVSYRVTIRSTTVQCVVTLMTAVL